MTTIIDVAKRAGVSVTTVSRVMNNSAHPVNAETRERVLEAVKDLNFVPNALARALASEETRLIGVIVGDASDPYFANIVRGISDTAQQKGYLTIICNTDRVPEVELRFLHLMRDYSADGVVMAGGGLTMVEHQQQASEIVNWLQEHGVPVIALGNQYLNVPQINVDDVNAVQELIEYLIGLGHRRIGCIAGPNNLSTSQLRLKGYRTALELHGIQYDPCLVINGDFTYESGQIGARELLRCQPVPTAIFGSNDRQAMGCLFELNQQSVRVPEQMSVAGFDDIDATQYLHPPLTTVHVPMHEIGVMGMQQILQAIEAGRLPEHSQFLPHRLIIRASTTAPIETARQE